MNPETEDATTTPAPRRRRRRVGPPATSATGGQGFQVPETPEDMRDFDEEFWKEQRPPHWG